ncbi:sigma 54-interacting transcriptional regulator [Halomonas campisalis]|uniref:Sigma 54-interacting transcriptional regulator n=1 Tax=Billgrantia campisalis TaxID=74661 RepID=A0ABS9PA09_9GAMM|nr:sigma 54-interacting transcriptional regulator [Halomonas campisalis]MCG6658606.1 sigma 54-interacting transcriptional regulator [Halomonas campisalis]MDR5863468.1 sigma 54-interacting transcriptional regulator [Halomonas campisalis]
MPREDSTVASQSQSLTLEAIRPLFPLLERNSAGAILVDEASRLTWINDSYCRLLGIDDPAKALGRPVGEVIPHTRMPEVVRSGRPILLDIMEYGAHQLVVARLPLHDRETGAISGAVAFIVFDDLEALTPLMGKYRRLQHDLAVARRALASRGARYALGDFIGASPAVLEVKRRARLAAARATPVLLLGETGTGKEVLAQAIHGDSPRCERPFVAVNVAAVPETLLEAEFFGVAPGAYTGADRRARQGKFQLADGGTLFLDEIGDMPLALQAKLLRALQEGEVEPLGSNEVKAVDVRLIAATSRDLEAMVAEGSFRSDLYYRLNVLRIRVPPLRERLADLGILCEAILGRLAAESGEPRAEITAEAVALLHRHHWPGNIRELRNTLEQTLALHEACSVIDVPALLATLPTPPDAPPEARPAPAPVRPLAEVVAEAERTALHNALDACDGNKSRAARLLGIPRSVLYTKLSRLSDTTDT